MSNTELEAGDNRDLIEEFACAIHVVESPGQRQSIAGKGVEFNCYTLWKR